MTSTEQGPPSAWPLGAWIMVAILAVVTALGVSVQVLAPGLLLDGIALWPGLLPASIALLIVALTKSWRRRRGAIPPLLLLTWIGLAGAAHFGGWVALPSSAGELVGPETAPPQVTLTLQTEGRLLIDDSDDGFLYEVRYVRLGGEVGVPEAVEAKSEDHLEVTVRDGGTSPWFRYAGWRLSLTPATEWSLDLTGDVDADLTGVPLDSLTLDGSGSVTLGQATEPTPVVIKGDYVLNLPAGDEGWIISVEDGGSLRINQP
jgi:hypothetical protein